MQIEMKADDFIVSKTDLKGRITYGNKTFIEMSGYSEKELLDAPHNILRHEDMPAVVFKLLWQRIQAGKNINAYVKNRCKNGDFYWVFAYVTPSYDHNKKLIGYYSVRRRPSLKALEVIEPLYKELLEVEKRESLERSLQTLEQTLQNKGMSYDELIITLQK